LKQKKADQGSLFWQRAKKLNFKNEAARTKPAGKNGRMGDVRKIGQPFFDRAVNGAEKQLSLKKKK